MRYAVFIRDDLTGPWPVVLGPDTGLHTFPEDARTVRWRLIAQTDDRREAERVRADLKAQIERGEL